MRRYRISTRAWFELALRSVGGRPFLSPVRRMMPPYQHRSGCAVDCPASASRPAIPESAETSCDDDTRGAQSMSSALRAAARACFSEAETRKQRAAVVPQLRKTKKEGVASSCSFAPSSPARGPTALLERDVAEVYSLLLSFREEKDPPLWSPTRQGR